VRGLVRAQILTWPRDGRMARFATRCVFFINGAVFSSWFVRIPSLQTSLHLSVAMLGVTVATPTVGALAAFQYTGRLTRRFGDRAMVCCAMIALPPSFILVSLARDIPQLLAAVAVFGAAAGMLDVTMNAEAVVVERAQGRPILNSCHATWSIGSVAGAVTAGWSVDAHWSFVKHAVVMGACMAVLIAASGHALLDGRDGSAADGSGVTRVSDWRAGWSRMVLLAGAMGAICLLTEGAMGDWSGVFLHKDRGLALGTASLGYIAFSAAETAVRLLGDRLLGRFGRVRLVRAGALVGAVCLAVTMAAPVAWGAIVGFLLIGACLAVIVPIVFGAVGHFSAENEGHAAVAVSRLTTLTYSSFIIGPPIVGWIASGVGLPLALGLLAAPLAWVGVKAGAILTQAAVTDPAPIPAAGTAERNAA
jgi:MFS family permease